jgi:hypothetical protein
MFRVQEQSQRNRLRNQALARKMFWRERDFERGTNQPPFNILLHDNYLSFRTSLATYIKLTVVQLTSLRSFSSLREGEVAPSWGTLTYLPSDYSAQSVNKIWHFSIALTPSCLISTVRDLAKSRELET